MKHTITHDLSDELARKAAHKAIDSYSERFSDYDPRVDWRDEDHATFSFQAKGIKLSGELAMRQNTIDVEMKVPFAFKLFQKKAISVIDAEITDWIARAKRGELDDEPVA